MNSARKITGLVVRGIICALLLLWIAHSIFAREGRAAVERAGGDWGKLDRGGQWRAAWTHGPRELAASVRRVSPVALGASFLLVGGTILLGVMRWRLVLRRLDLDLPFARAAKITLVAQFFNSFLLGSTGGDLVKAYYTARETHHRKTEGVTAVFVDRVIGLGAMLLFACVMMAFNAGLLGGAPRLIPIALFVAAMAAGCLGVLGVAFFGGVSRLWPGARTFGRRLPMGAHLERSLEACREFGRSRRSLLGGFVLSMAVNLLCVLQIAVLCAGLDVEVPFLALMMIVPMIICVSSLPITPSGLGVRENLFVWMLGAPGLLVPPTEALLLSLLMFAGGLFWSIVGGAVYFAIRDREHLEEVTGEDAAGT